MVSHNNDSVTEMMDMYFYLDFTLIKTDFGVEPFQ